ncbi:MAG: hypothetical protein V7K48_34685 [Nostoc sp.]|uniref:hypothetical protein n=1 Tax=Nostoc sp. TaxID=1180 RepID=UPI002FFA45DE
MPLFPGDGFEIPTSIKTALDNSDYLLLVDENEMLCKIKVTDFLASLSNDNTGSNLSAKLVGTPFGASPSYQAGREYDKAFDGDLTTIYDYAYSSGGFCGLDLGASNTKKLTKVRVYPRQDAGVQTRSGGARIQGSNNQLSGYVDLFTFPPTLDTGIWYEGIVSVYTAYRYLRYYAADGTYCSVSEVEFYGV